MPIRKEFRKNYQNLERNSDPIYMTEKELQELKKLAEEKKQALDEATKAIWEATEQSSETRHDNAPFDAAVEQSNLLSKQYQDLVDQIRRVVIVEPTLETDKVVFGTTVEVLINLKMKKTFTIWWVSKPNEGKITMDSPLWEAIMWKKEWEEWKFTVWTRESTVRVMKILQS